MGRIKEIALLLNIGMDEAERVLEVMEESGLDFSECEQEEFDECARESWAQVKKEV